MIWVALSFVFCSALTALVRHERQHRSGAPQPLQLSVTAPRVSRRASRSRRCTSLAQAQEGEYITVTGVIQSSADNLTAPLSGTTCVAYAASARTIGVSHAADLPPLVDFHEMKV